MQARSATSLPRNTDTAVDIFGQIAVEGVGEHNAVITHDPARFSIREAFASGWTSPVSGFVFQPESNCPFLPQLDGGQKISWIRRTRIGGDTWPGSSGDVPLGETSEAYRVEIGQVDGDPVRVVDTSAPFFNYTGTMRAADGLTGAFRIRVAQIGEVYGAGEFAALMVPT